MEIVRGCFVIEQVALWGVGGSGDEFILFRLVINIK